MILIMGIIFFLSHQPGDSFDLPQMVNIDKVLHCLVYFVLGISVCYAIPKQWWQDRSSCVMTGVVAFCLFYGITDELHQWFIPGRFPSGLDLAADTLGGCLAVAGYCIFRFYLEQNKRRHTSLGCSRHS